MRKNISLSESETNKLRIGIRTGRLPAMKKQQACRMKSGTNLVSKIIMVMSSLSTLWYWTPTLFNWVNFTNEISNNPKKNSRNDFRITVLGIIFISWLVWRVFFDVYKSRPQHDRKLGSIIIFNLLTLLLTMPIEFQYF